MTGGKRRKNKRRKMKMRTKISLTWINSCYDSVMIVDKIINFRMRRIQ